MLILILIVACILLLTIYMVASVRQHDADSYADQDRDPFFAESARLAAAGLLYEQAERTYGRPRTSYTITPAGEAALRTWLREPMNDPGMLKLYFAGIVAPTDVIDLARQQKERHARRLEEYDRIESLLGPAPEQVQPDEKGEDQEREEEEEEEEQDEQTSKKKKKKEKKASKSEENGASEDEEDEDEDEDAKEDLSAADDGWNDAREAMALGRKFEQFCTDFWASQVDDPVKNLTLGEERRDH
ncbi:PadR family transcriptional regulator [Aestuariibius insulae]|uniref:PadR family transcriptional regulator n=1 Tax=Aestuariibius insulae TaxID=2058287 RepID=UPI00345E6937